MNEMMGTRQVRNGTGWEKYIKSSRKKINYVLPLRASDFSCSLVRNLAIVIDCTPSFL